MKTFHSKGKAEKNKKSLKAHTPRNCKMNRHQHDRKEARIGNRGFVNVRVQC